MRIVQKIAFIHSWIFFQAETAIPSRRRREGKKRNESELVVE